MDIDKLKNQRVSKTNNKDEGIAFSQSIGARQSAMEHLVPEQMFSTEIEKAQGISTVKALAIASAQGQKIWTISQQNLTTAMSQLMLSAEAENDIRNAVNAGKVVTAHEQRVNFNGWVGEGYSVIDPKTGAGGYLISGGGNGGEVTSSRTTTAVGVSGGLDGMLAGSVLAAFLPSIGSVLKCLTSALLPILSIALFFLILMILRLTLIGLIAGILIPVSVSAGSAKSDECGLTCDDHFTNCLGSSIQSQPGPLFGSSACVLCRDQCVQNGNVWPDIARPFSGSAKRCDYWNFK